MFIYTSRLVLRPTDHGDVDDLVRLDADPEVMRFVNGGYATPRDTIENWILPRAQAVMRAGAGGMWTVVDRVRGDFIGWQSLRTPLHSRLDELELTYRMRREWWGLGVASEAAAALIDMSFQETRAHRVFASTTTANVGSRRVMEKVGMQLSAVHRSEPGVESGMSDMSREEVEFEYELLRPHWEMVTSSWMSGEHRLGEMSA